MCAADAGLPAGAQNACKRHYRHKEWLNMPSAATASPATASCLNCMSHGLLQSPAERGCHSTNIMHDRSLSRSHRHCC
jgi:hypothetical protein